MTNSSLPSFRTAVVFAVCTTLLTQVSLGAVSESNIWSERQRGSRKPVPIAMAALPSAMPVPSAILNELPAVGSALTKLGATSTTLFKNTQRTQLGKFQTLVEAIPANLASVQIVHDSKTPNASTVVLIQDVHMNAEAQTNIAGVIQTLIDNKKVSAVAIEGTFGPLPIEPFRKFQNQQVVATVANSLLKAGVMAAPSYVGMTSATTPPLITGIDDRHHYDRNVAAYLNTRGQKGTVEKQLARYEADLSREKTSYFSSELTRFDQLRVGYHRGQVGIGVYVESLVRLQPAAADLDFVLERFLSAYAIERHLDFTKVEAERGRVIQSLVNKLSHTEIDALLNASLAYRSGELGFGDYYQGLRSLCEKKHVSLEQAPAFASYVRYVLLTDGIKAESLFDAILRLENRLSRDLAKTPEQEKFLERHERLLLAEKLIAFSLTPTEWQRYRQLADLTPSLTSQFPNLTAFETFYTEADIRSHRMVERTMTLSKQHSALILVAGGFHTPEIADLLRGRNVSYVVVTPKITKVDSAGGAAYLSVFSREKTPLDKLFAGETLFVAPLTANLNPVPFVEWLSQMHARTSPKLGTRNVTVDLSPAGLRGSVETTVDVTSDPATDRVSLRPLLFAVIESFAIKFVMAALVEPLLAGTPTFSAGLAVLSVLAVLFALLHKDLYQESSYPDGKTFARVAYRFAYRALGFMVMASLLSPTFLTLAQNVPAINGLSGVLMQPHNFLGFSFSNGFILVITGHLILNSVYVLAKTLGWRVADRGFLALSMGSDDDDTFVGDGEELLPLDALKTKLMKVAADIRDGNLSIIGIYHYRNLLRSLFSDADFYDSNQAAVDALSGAIQGRLDRLEDLSAEIAQLENAIKNLEENGFTKSVTIADQHGDPRYLRKVLALVEQGEIERVIFLGDLFDRGAGNLECFDLVRKLNNRLGDKFVFLLGNHDQLFLQSMLQSTVQNPLEFHNWINNGGNLFLNEILPGAGDEIQQMPLGRLSDEQRKRYVEIFQQTQASEKLNEITAWLMANAEIKYVDELGYLHVHAGFKLDQNGTPRLGRVEGADAVRLQLLTLDSQWQSLKRLYLQRQSAPREFSNAFREFNTAVFDLLWAREWYNRVDQDEHEIEPLVRSLGVRGIIFGHQHEVRWLNRFGRLMCLDADREGDSGKGFVRFTSDTVQWEDLSDFHQVVSSKREVLIVLLRDLIHLKREARENIADDEERLAVYEEDVKLETRTGADTRLIASTMRNDAAYGIDKLFRSDLQQFTFTGLTGRSDEGVEVEAGQSILVYTGSRYKFLVHPVNGKYVVFQYRRDSEVTPANVVSTFDLLPRPIRINGEMRYEIFFSRSDLKEEDLLISGQQVLFETTDYGVFVRNIGKNAIALGVSYSLVLPELREPNPEREHAMLRESLMAEFQMAVQSKRATETTFEEMLRSTRYAAIEDASEQRALKQAAQLMLGLYRDKNILLLFDRDPLDPVHVTIENITDVLSFVNNLLEKYLRALPQDLIDQLKDPLVVHLGQLKKRSMASEFGVSATGMLGNGGVPLNLAREFVASLLRYPTREGKILFAADKWVEFFRTQGVNSLTVFDTVYPDGKARIKHLRRVSVEEYFSVNQDPQLLLRRIESLSAANILLNKHSVADLEKMSGLLLETVISDKPSPIEQLIAAAVGDQNVDMQNRADVERLVKNTLLKGYSFDSRRGVWKPSVAIAQTPISSPTAPSSEDLFQRLFAQLSDPNDRFVVLGPADSIGETVSIFLTRQDLEIAQQLGLLDITAVASKIFVQIKSQGTDLVGKLSKQDAIRFLILQSAGKSLIELSLDGVASSNSLSAWIHQVYTDAIFLDANSGTVSAHHNPTPGAYFTPDWNVWNLGILMTIFVLFPSSAHAFFDVGSVSLDKAVTINWMSVGVVGFVTMVVMALGLGVYLKLFGAKSTADRRTGSVVSEANRLATLVLALSRAERAGAISSILSGDEARLDEVFGENVKSRARISDYESAEFISAFVEQLPADFHLDQNKKAFILSVLKRLGVPNTILAIISNLQTRRTMVMLVNAKMTDAEISAGLATYALSNRTALVAVQPGMESRFNQIHNTRFPKVPVEYVGNPQLWAMSESKYALPVTYILKNLNLSNVPMNDLALLHSQTLNIFDQTGATLLINLADLVPLAEIPRINDLPVIFERIMQAA